MLLPKATAKSSPARGGGPRSGGGVSPYRKRDTPPSGLQAAISLTREDCPQTTICCRSGTNIRFLLADVQ
ncbi:MAG TPA: hypothetical protein DHB48_05240 [Sphingobium sp.]|nr:hypothetical protein [Sphingobium sp.]